MSKINPEEIDDKLTKLKNMLVVVESEVDKTSMILEKELSNKDRKELKKHLDKLTNGYAKAKSMIEICEGAKELLDKRNKAEDRLKWAGDIERGNLKIEISRINEELEELKKSVPKRMGLFGQLKTILEKRHERPPKGMVGFLGRKKTDKTRLSEELRNEFGLELYKIKLSNRQIEELSEKLSKYGSLNEINLYEAGICPECGGKKVTQRYGEFVCNMCNPEIEELKQRPAFIGEVEERPEFGVLGKKKDYLSKDEIYKLCEEAGKNSPVAAKLEFIATLIKGGKSLDAMVRETKKNARFGGPISQNMSPWKKGAISRFYVEEFKKLYKLTNEEERSKDELNTALRKIKEKCEFWQEENIEEKYLRRNPKKVNGYNRLKEYAKKKNLSLFPEQIISILEQPGNSSSRGGKGIKSIIFIAKLRDKVKDRFGVDINSEVGYDIALKKNHILWKNISDEWLAKNTLHHKSIIRNVKQFSKASPLIFGREMSESKIKAVIQKLQENNVKLSCNNVVELVENAERICDLVKEGNTVQGATSSVIKRLSENQVKTSGKKLSEEHNNKIRALRKYVFGVLNKSSLLRAKIDERLHSEIKAYAEEGKQTLTDGEVIRISKQHPNDYETILDLLPKIEAYAKKKDLVSHSYTFKIVNCAPGTCKDIVFSASELKKRLRDKYGIKTSDDNCMGYALGNRNWNDEPEKDLIKNIRGCTLENVDEIKLSENSELIFGKYIDPHKIEEVINNLMNGGRIFSLNSIGRVIIRSDFGHTIKEREIDITNMDDLEKENDKSNIRVTGKRVGKNDTDVIEFISENPDKKQVYLDVKKYAEQKEVDLDVNDIIYITKYHYNKYKRIIDAFLDIQMYAEENEFDLSKNEIMQLIREYLSSYRTVIDYASNLRYIQVKKYGLQYDDSEYINVAMRRRQKSNIDEIIEKSQYGKANVINPEKFSKFSEQVLGKYLESREIERVINELFELSKKPTLRNIRALLHRKKLRREFRIDKDIDYCIKVQLDETEKTKGVATEPIRKLCYSNEPIRNKNFLIGIKRIYGGNIPESVIESIKELFRSGKSNNVPVTYKDVRKILKRYAGDVAGSEEGGVSGGEEEVPSKKAGLPGKKGFVGGGITDVFEEGEDSNNNDEDIQKIQNAVNKKGTSRKGELNTGVLTRQHLFKSFKRFMNPNGIDYKPDEKSTKSSGFLKRIENKIKSFSKKPDGIEKNIKAGFELINGEYVPEKNLLTTTRKASAFFRLGGIASSNKEGEKKLSDYLKRELNLNLDDLNLQYWHKKALSTDLKLYGKLKPISLFEVGICPYCYNGVINEELGEYRCNKCNRTDKIEESIIRHIPEAKGKAWEIVLSNKTIYALCKRAEKSKDATIAAKLGMITNHIKNGQSIGNAIGLATTILNNHNCNKYENSNTERREREIRMFCNRAFEEIYRAGRVHDFGSKGENIFTRKHEGSFFPYTGKRKKEYEDMTGAVDSNNSYLKEQENARTSNIAIGEEGGKVLEDTSKNSKDLLSKISEERARELWVNADSRIMRLIPKEESRYWGSMNLKEREDIYDAIKRGEKPYYADTYPQKIIGNKKVKIPRNIGGLLDGFLKKGSKITELSHLIKKGEIPLYTEKELGEYDIKQGKPSFGGKGCVQRIYAKDEEGNIHKIAVKTPWKSKQINKSEYDNIRIFRKFLPSNVPIVYDDLTMELIEGRTLENVPEKELKNQRFFAELGRIIAVMHNHNFIHRDLVRENIILDEKGVWKLIDFGESIHLEEEIENIDSKLLIYQKNEFDDNGSKLVFCNCYSESINSNFYQNYLVHRNLIEIAPYVILQKKDNKTVDAFFEFVLFIVEKITNQSEQVDDYLSNFIDKTRNVISRYSEKEILERTRKDRLKIKLAKFIKKIEQNPNIHLHKTEKIKEETPNTTELTSLENKYNDLVKSKVYNEHEEKFKHNGLEKIREKINNLRTPEHREIEVEEAQKQGRSLNNFLQMGSKGKTERQEEDKSRIYLKETSVSKVVENDRHVVTAAKEAIKKAENTINQI